MPEYVITPPGCPAVATTSGDGLFPIRRIFCVGQNYANHVLEMGGTPDRDPPFFFSKPPDAIVGNGETISYPPQTVDFHHEAELVVAIGKAGSDISVGDALNHVWGYGAGNDLTRRDIQAKAKNDQRPWDMAKGFDRSAVCGSISETGKTGHMENARITCSVNGEIKQDSNISEMSWSVPEIIGHLSRLIAIRPGDLIYTGTPAGVGPLIRGDTCRVEISGLEPVEIAVK